MELQVDQNAVIRDLAKQIADLTVQNTALRIALEQQAAASLAEVDAEVA